jgi:hypothetical protein
MSARTPRLRFSNPFVITVAGVGGLVAAPACFVQSRTPPSQSVAQAEPGQPTVADPRPEPPPPQTQSPTIIANPPRPSANPSGPPSAPPPPPPEAPPESRPPPVIVSNPPRPQLPGSDDAWMITHTSRGCQAMAITHCPPNAMCNPPPPRPYACIDGARYPVKVTRVGNACQTEPDPAPPCPANARCKQVPPRTVPCPS